MKKEYLINLIEKGYEGGTSYDDYVSVFIDQLKNDNSFELANSIQNIKDKSAKIKKTNNIRSSKTINFEGFYFPKKIVDEIENIKIGYKKGLINKILLKGNPGTGKTTFVEFLSKELNLRLINVKLSDIMDYKYGESIKKIEMIMKTYSDTPCILFFDEADSIFSNRFIKNDLLETSRILTTMLKILDSDSKAMICFATNLYKNIDSALIRRVDIILDFNCYSNYEYQNILNSLDYRYELNLNETQKVTILKNLKNISLFSPSYLNILCKKIAINNISNKESINTIIKTYFQELTNE